MRSVFIVTLLSISCIGYANAEIATKKQADQFIEKYCISLVNNLEKNLKRSEQVTGDEAIIELLATGAETSQIIETYIKLCK